MHKGRLCPFNESIPWLIRLSSLIKLYLLIYGTISESERLVNPESFFIANNARTFGPGKDGLSY